jgi:hypothetical protein
MAWNTLSEADVQNYLLPDEQTILNAIQGSSSVLPTVMADVISQAQSQILAGGNQIGATGTVPDQLKMPIIAIILWEWFTSLPKTDLQSDGRKEKYDKAMERLSMITGSDPKREKIEIPASPQAVAGPTNRVSTVRRGQEVRQFGKIGQT